MKEKTDQQEMAEVGLFILQIILIIREKLSLSPIILSQYGSKFFQNIKNLIYCLSFTDLRVVQLHGMSILKKT